MLLLHHDGQSGLHNLVGRLDGARRRRLETSGRISARSQANVDRTGALCGGFTVTEHLPNRGEQRLGGEGFFDPFGAFERCKRVFHPPVSVT